MRVGFVVLHYFTFDDTFLCVESIRMKNKDKDYKIVIVDNGSTNNSLSELKKIYYKEDYITIISNEKNLGFAAGNNVGIRYLNEKYSPDFIVVMNSDIILLDNDLYDILIKEYNKTNFSVLGPMVCLPNGLCNCNPTKESVDYTEITRCKRELKREQIFLNLHIYFLYKLLKKRKHKRNLKNKKTKGLADYLMDKTECVLHGCCLVFSKQYFEKFDGFDESTFLYFEEEILFIHCKEHGLVMQYCPKIRVFHNQGASTYYMRKGERKRMKWVINNCLHSVMELERIYCSYKSNSF